MRSRGLQTDTVKKLERLFEKQFLPWTKTEGLVYLANNIDAFPVKADGTLAPIVVNSNPARGSFSVTFAPNGVAIVSETGLAGGTNGSAISSYDVNANGTLTAISHSVPP
jgi:hypothetical protein